jgi:squalene-hopene/tetraprenyl-beta-curcumene cyclase
VGSLEPRAIVAAVIKRYGNDRTFAAPILTLCALAGRLGTDPWELVSQLPFELAALPHRLFRWLRLPVVSYALPALISIGLVRHVRRPARAAWLRELVRRRVLDILTGIQPANGGFLEATPLTAFVVMGMAASGYGSHPVTARGVEFILKSMRADGCWPIDTNLATWVTTLAVNAGAGDWLDVEERAAVRDWLLGQQFQEEHPFTHGAPGGWAWTDLPGGVPDADDTAGALLALRRLGPLDGRVRRAGRLGVRWLLDMQNRDGGIPTFCRGWGTLPFDRSCPDLTAHAIRAFVAWREDVEPALQSRIQAATARALRYLARSQRADGSWTPLWFGNQFEAKQENPTYGTAQVLISLRGLPEAERLTAAGIRWLELAQNEDGGWGGARGLASSVEETALAVAALTGHARGEIVTRGLDWLSRNIDMPPASIGLYFASLWYYERLYPLVFAAAALVGTPA